MKIITRIESIRAREHEATVALITALVECDRERAHITLGYSSMWDFLTRHLHYSNAAASRRYKAMKCARQFPRVLDMLRKHETNLSALAAAEATLMRATNADGLLGRIANMSQSQVEQELARHNPQPKKRETVRRFASKPDSKASVPEPDMFTLCAPSSAAAVRTSETVDAAQAVPTSGTAGQSPAVRTSETQTPSTPVRTSSVPEVTEPEDRVQLGFSVTAETYEKFERAKALLSGKHPKGLTLEEAFEELLESFLATRTREPKPRKAKPKTSSTAESESNATPKPTTRHIPAATRRAVMKRDHGRCTYVGPTGTRCNSTHDVELDHVQPWAAGGTHDAENLRVLCATHNRHRNLTMREPSPCYGASAPEVRTSETARPSRMIRTSEAPSPRKLRPAGSSAEARPRPLATFVRFRSGSVGRSLAGPLWRPARTGGWEDPAARGCPEL